MNNKYSYKLKTAVITTVLALGITGTALATPTELEPLPISGIDLSKEFRIDISPAMVGWSGADYYTYLYYTPVDVTVPGDRWGYNHDTTYKAGVLYLIKGTETGDADSANEIKDESAVALGDAADIFGEGFSEDEIKDLISDAIHKVDGDQTVTGSVMPSIKQTATKPLLATSKLMASRL